PAAIAWRPASMKSGPTLNGWTTRPRRRSASMSPSVTVVLPTELAVPASTSTGGGIAVIGDWKSSLGPRDGSRGLPAPQPRAAALQYNARRHDQRAAPRGPPGPRAGPH